MKYTYRSLSSKDCPVPINTDEVFIPTHWSDKAGNILANKYMRFGADPVSLEKLSKLEFPLSVATVTELMKNDTLVSTPLEGSARVHENHAQAVFARMVLCWASWAFRSGYFKGDDAIKLCTAYINRMFDHLYSQKVAPNSPQWFNTGLYFAYGLAAPAKGGWHLENGVATPSDRSFVHPQAHACFINSVQDSLCDKGGILDLWSREAHLFKYGSGTGTNFSSLRGTNEPLTNGGHSSGLISFLRVGDTGAGAIKSGGTTRRAAKMVIVNADHPDVEEFIGWKSREENKVRALVEGSRLLRKHGVTEMPELTFDWQGEAYGTVSGQNSNNSIRATDAFMHAVLDDADWDLIRRTDGTAHKTVKARDLFNKICQATKDCGDPALQFHDTINNWHTCPLDGDIEASNPCSEYHFLNDTACNLASLNLVKFARKGKSFDYKDFRTVIDDTILTLDVSITMAEYPSALIAQRSHDYRTLGLGYANLGALLMRWGLPYDSNAARDVAREITAYMNIAAWAQSANLAECLSPYVAFERNAAAHNRVLGMHLSNAPAKFVLGGANLPVILGRPMRNAQVTVLAPTGTIAFVMDCDTTGIEPDYSLVKHKYLAGGGKLTIINQSVTQALKNLGYTDTQELLDYLEKHGHFEGSSLKPEHLAVFDCANKCGTTGMRFISWRAHLDMLEVVTPHLSGGISKTINMPAGSTVEEIAEAYILAWKKGIKCVAIYPDGAKSSQPLVTTEKDKEPTAEAKKAPKAILRGTRVKLPARRGGYTQKALIGGQSIYIRTGEYKDGSLGEIFIDMAREGAFVRSVMNCFAQSVSIGLQYGAPLAEFVDAFVFSNFEPNGMVQGHERIKNATSLMDYIFRELAIQYLGRDDLAHVQPEPQEDFVKAPHGGGIDAQHSGAESVPKAKIAVGNPCPECGALALVRNGTCMKCEKCGATTGCS